VCEKEGRGTLEKARKNKGKLRVNLIQGMGMGMFWCAYLYVNRVYTLLFVGFCCLMTLSDHHPLVKEWHRSTEIVLPVFPNTGLKGRTGLWNSACPCPSKF
jgi:hypothetical protein